jgi:hypothetical protein
LDGVSGKFSLDLAYFRLHKTAIKEA